MTDPVPDDPWQAIRPYTNARIGLRRYGDSQSTAASLAFQHDHAQARDAVHTSLDVAAIVAGVRGLGLDALAVRSAAHDRDEYLKRPDFGRRLDDASRAALDANTVAAATTYDVVFVVADGLSALAVERHALALLDRCVGRLRERGWRIGPVVVAKYGRVALGDDIGAILRAEQVTVLIGERPGLSVADSLGVYLTYAPCPGRTDAERNCASNIHAAGLGYAQATDILTYLMTVASVRKLTGVALKDESQHQSPMLDG